MTSPTPPFATIEAEQMAGQEARDILAEIRLITGCPDDVRLTEHVHRLVEQREFAEAERDEAREIAVAFAGVQCCVAGDPAVCTCPPYRARRLRALFNESQEPAQGRSHPPTPAAPVRGSTSTEGDS